MINRLGNSIKIHNLPSSYANFHYSLFTNKGIYRFQTKRGQFHEKAFGVHKSHTGVTMISQAKFTQNTQSNQPIQYHKPHQKFLPPINEKKNVWSTNQESTKDLIAGKECQTNNLISCFEYFLGCGGYKIANEIFLFCGDKKLKRYFELKLLMETKKFEDAIALVQYISHNLYLL